MNYRLANKEDEEKIFRLIEKLNVGRTTLGVCFVAEDENGKIIGYINSQLVPIIDMASENTLVAGRLFGMMEGYNTAKGFTSIIMFTIKDYVKLLAVKVGFKKIKEEHDIFLKEI